jgi:serine protease Do
VGLLVRWLGHDAAIYGGNSGGPLVNLRGEIIGINEIRFGLSGAIPGNLAKSIAEQLIASGRIERSWLGLDAQPVFKHSGSDRGVLVSGVIGDSPASRAGFQSGDVLVRLAGVATNVRYDEQMPDFTRLTTSLSPGKEVEAQVLRAGKPVTLRVTPISRGEVNPKQQELKPWGMTARNVSFLVAREIKRTNQLGVLVTSVRAGGPAGEAKPALEPRDVLVKVNDRSIGHLEDLLRVTAEIARGKSAPVPVIATFEREARRYLTVVRVGIEELRDPGLEVRKAWLPVETHVISRDIARQFGNPELKGFYITQVYADTTADQAGLQAGDFIVAVDGEKLTASAPEHQDDLAALIRQYDIGAKVELSLLRGNEAKKVQVELMRSPKLRREMKKYRNDDFEFTVRDISFFDAAEQQWNPDQKGALVEDVKSGSWAEVGSLYVGDLIVEVDGRSVTDSDSLRKIMEEIARLKKPFVVMKVVRGIHTASLELEPTWAK